MKQRLVLINVGMFGGILFCALQLVSAWESFDQTNSVQRIVAAAQVEPAAINPLQVQSFDRLRPYSDFMVIPEKDLFNEDRRAASSSGEAGDEAAAAAKPPAWAVRPTLHGISAAAGRKQALLTIYEGKKGKGQMRKVGVGDDVQGYQVAEIANTVVKLRWREQEEIIDMADASARQPAAKPQKVAAVTVITVGAAKAAVQATTAAAPAPEERGIQVGVVQGARAAAGRMGAGGRGGQGRSDDRDRDSRRGRNQGSLSGNQRGMGGMGGMGSSGLGGSNSRGMGSQGGLSGNRRNSRLR